MVSADEVGVSRGLSGMGCLCGGDMGVFRGAAGAAVSVGPSREGSGVRDGDEVGGGMVWGVVVEARERVCGVVASSEWSQASSVVVLAVGSTGKGVE